jgi:hypothetical protein
MMECVHIYVIRGNILEAKYLCFDARGGRWRTKVLLLFRVSWIGDGVIPATTCE